MMSSPDDGFFLLPFVLYPFNPFPREPSAKRSRILEFREFDFLWRRALAHLAVLEKQRDGVLVCRHP